MGAKAKLSVPERRKVVLSLIRREEPAAVLARRYGISENTLYRWRDDFLTAGQEVSWAYQGFIFARSYSVSHADATWFVGAIPPDPEGRRGLLAAV